jgi:rsbT co-antagonist protein RsbR
MNKPVKNNRKMKGENGNITEIKEIKDALDKQREEQEVILDSVPAWIFYKDKENRFIRVNTTFAEVMGIPREQLEGKSCFDLYPKDQAKAFLEDDLAVIASGKPKRNIIESMLSPKGTLWVQTDKIPYRDTQGVIIGIIGFTIDITERKKAEEELKKVNEQLQKEITDGKRREEIISKQTQEILELSTPVLQIMDGVVVAPLIGTIDSQRTQQFMERFLGTIVKTNSPIALVDITGVPTLDTQTAQHLIEAVTAATLLGAKVIVTGVSPAIAQTLVHLGIDLSDITTKSSLSAGLKVALEFLGLTIAPKK